MVHAKWKELRRLTVGLVTVLIAVALVACGGDDEADSGNASSGGSETAASTETAEKKTIGLAIDGPKNDKAFSQAHFDGISDAIAEVGNLELTSTVENVADPVKGLDALKNLATAGNDLVIAGGGGLLQPLETVAQQFPDTHFVGGGAALTKEYDNITTLVWEEGLPSIPAGAVMAKLTKTKKIGFIGGAEIALTEQSAAGVEVGAHSVDPSIKVSSTIVGSFNDAGKAKAAAQAMIDEGVDQIFAFLDSATQGVYQAAEASGKDIGVYQIIIPRCDESKTVVGSIVLSIPAIMLDITKSFAEGNLKPGTIFYTLKNPEIQRFELCPDAATPELEKVVEETTAAVNSGDLDPGKAAAPRPDFAFEER